MLPTLLTLLLVSLPTNQDPGNPASSKKPQAIETEVALPEIGHPAPAHAFKHWIGDPASTNEKKLIVKKVNSEDRQNQPQKLSELNGRVVLIHIFRPSSQDAINHTIPLLRDLYQANDDRGIGIISSIPKDEADETLLAQLNLSWPIALISGTSTSPYLSPIFPTDNYIWLISRSGFVTWHGDPKRMGKEFLATLEQLLVQFSAPSLERKLTPMLNNAVSAYADGKWEAARRMAEKLSKKHGNKPEAEDIIICEDALHLASVVSAYEIELMHQAFEALEKNRPFRFLQYEKALDEGFPKSDARKRVALQFKDYKRTRIGTSLEDGIALKKILENRPLFFPIHKSSAGDKLGKELEKFLLRSSNVIEPTQLARKLLDQYSSGVRKR